MRSFLFVPRSASLALLGSALCTAAFAQTFAAGTGTATVLGADIPRSVPSALPPHHKKTSAPLIYARVRDGVYSVDGMVGKVRLNYDVKAANYLYFFVPGLGTAVVSLAPAEDAISSSSVYHDGELTLRVGDHTLNLTGVESLVNDKGKVPAKVFVHLDRESWKLNRTPMMGFGAKGIAPFEWPGALSESTTAEQPMLPVPASMLPRKTSFQVPETSMQ